eukprot:392553_1
MNICFVYLCITSKHGTFYLQDFDVLLTDKTNLTHTYLNVHNGFPLFIYCTYILGIIARDKRIKCLSSNSNCYFMCCLSEAQKYINEPRSMQQAVILHPYIALSYYQIGINTANSNLYQIAFKCIMKAIKFGKDLSIIKNNCVSLLLYCKKNWREQNCSCCGLKNTNSNNKSLRSCKGCGEVFYCSRKCQKIDWKATHRYLCSKYWLNFGNYIHYVWFYS